MKAAHKGGELMESASGRKHSTLSNKGESRERRSLKNQQREDLYPRRISIGAAVAVSHEPNNG
jgi:hypothetical protein